MRTAFLPAALVLGACAVPSEGTPSPELVQRVEALNPSPCNEATAEVLAGAGLSADQLRELYYQPVLGGANHRLLGYLVWVRLVDQPGHLVADMDPDCRMRTVYTRDGMVLAGLPAY